MSKTVDELIGVYNEASNAVVWEAEKRGLLPMTLDMQRAGIAAVVRAMRDEMQLGDWTAWHRLNEIIGSDAGAGKVAGGSTREESGTDEKRGSKPLRKDGAEVSPRLPDPATDPIRNAVAMARGRTLAVDDIPTLNKLAAMTPDIEGLVKRLREVIVEDRGHGHTTEWTRNLDGHEAADALEAMAGEVERWRGIVALRDDEVERLKTAIEYNGRQCIDTMNKMHEQHTAERDRLAASEERMRSALIDEQRLRGRMYARAEAAESERDRLKAALVEQVKQYPDYSDICRKALGGDAS